MWSNPEKAAVAMAKRALGWQRPQYELLLRNIAGIRQECGKISSTNFSATNAGFVRLMAYFERQGYQDPKRQAWYWCSEAQKQCPRMHWAIQQLAARGIQAGILSGADALVGFVRRMTQARPEGELSDLAQLDAEWSYKILEGLKAWLWREAKRRGLPLDLTTESQSRQEDPIHVDPSVPGVVR